MEKLDLNKFDKIVILAPHPDDEVLGCSSLFDLDYRSKLSICYITDGCFYNYPKIRSKAAREIRYNELSRLCRYCNVPFTYFGIKDTHVRESINLMHEGLIKHCKDNGLFGKKVLWFVPHYEESHQDHIHTNFNFHHIRFFNIRTGDTLQWEFKNYEVWTPMKEPKYYLEVNEAIKKNLLSFYPSQTITVPYVDGILGLNKYRGLQMLSKKPIEVFS